MNKITLLTVALIFMTSTAWGYNPHSFTDEEEINVHGKRPQVEIVVSELDVTILETDFVDGVAEKRVAITNEGNVPCRLDLELQNVPIDLQVRATVDTEFLMTGETTDLNIVVELTEQQAEANFDFTILVKARLRP